MGEPTKHQGQRSEVRRHVGSIQQWERAEHKSQGTSPGQGHPVNLSQVLAPDIRNCRTETTARVEKKDLLRHRLPG
jgi:hypothetical protein